MEYKGTLIVVKDCKKAFEYYHKLFGLNLISDNDGNMELSHNIYLQEEKYWSHFLGKEIVSQNNSAELYFTEKEIESFVTKLREYYPDTVFVNELMTHSWGQKVVRFYDPDGNLIEVGTPLED